MVSFTTDELREVNDALFFAIDQMRVRPLHNEQDKAHLAAAWSAQKKVMAVLLPGEPSPWVVKRERLIQKLIEGSEK